MEAEVPVLLPDGVQAVRGGGISYDRDSKGLCPRGGVVIVQSFTVIFINLSLAVRHAYVKVLAAPVVTVEERTSGEKYKIDEIKNWLSEM